MCSLTFNFASARTKCFLASTRKYLPQFHVSILWKNYRGRSSLKTHLKVTFLLSYTGSRKVLENIYATLHPIFLLYTCTPSCTFSSIPYPIPTTLPLVPHSNVFPVKPCPCLYFFHTAFTVTATEIPKTIVCQSPIRRNQSKTL